jgi:hypothetical protein
MRALVTELGPGADGSERIHLSVRDGRALQAVGSARRIVSAVPAFAEPFTVARDDHGARLDTRKVSRIAGQVA